MKKKLCTAKGKINSLCVSNKNTKRDSENIKINTITKFIVGRKWSI